MVHRIMCNSNNVSPGWTQGARTKGSRCNINSALGSLLPGPPTLPRPAYSRMSDGPGHRLAGPSWREISRDSREHCISGHDGGAKQVTMLGQM